MAAAVEKAVKLLRSLGAKIDTVDPGFPIRDRSSACVVVVGARALLGRLPCRQEEAARSGLLADVVNQSMEMTPE